MTCITNTKTTTQRLIRILCLLVIMVYGCGLKQPKNYGRVDTALFLSDGELQPLVVGFGGSEGGNVYASEETKEVRELFLKNGFAFLSVGYFRSANTPPEIDRISINVIYDTIQTIASHPKIDRDRIVLLGGSRGGELALNIGSHYSGFGAIVAIVAPGFNLPSRFGWNATSSWSFNNEEIPYAPASKNALKKLTDGDFYGGVLEMSKENDVQDEGRIQIEKMDCPVLFISAKEDEVWPSTLMAEQMVERLKKNNYRYFYQHIPVNGNHAEPAKHFDLIIDFLVANMQ